MIFVQNLLETEYFHFEVLLYIFINKTILSITNSDSESFWGACLRGTLVLLRVKTTRGINPGIATWSDTDHFVEFLKLYKSDN